MKICATGEGKWREEIQDFGWFAKNKVRWFDDPRFSFEIFADGERIYPVQESTSEQLYQVLSRLVSYKGDLAFSLEPVGLKGVSSEDINDAIDLLRTYDHLKTDKESDEQ